MRRRTADPKNHSRGSKTELLQSDATEWHVVTDDQIMTEHVGMYITQLFAGATLC